MPDMAWRSTKMSRKESDADQDGEENEGGILVICASLDFPSLAMSADLFCSPDRV